MAARRTRSAITPVPAVEAFDTYLSQRPWERRTKRGFDILTAALGLVVTFPIMLAIALLVATTSPGSPLFRQRRVGRDGRLFTIWKFRTMYSDAEQRLEEDLALHTAHRENGFKFPPGEDPRVTPVGHRLRTTSLDELPQLLNVLLGHMSLVGPRPVTSRELAHYEDNVAAYLAVRPGITGAWQIRGRSNIAFPERGEIDAEYVRRWTLRGDIRILLGTVPAVLRKTGAH